jgi:threonine aldolase
MQFGSDNQTGASARVLEMLAMANTGFTPGYGGDDWTEQAVKALRQVFACDLDAFFVSTGTAANALALSCLVRPWETVLCHHQAHILIDESTAPEFLTGGARLIPISRGAGKLNVEQLARHCGVAGTDVPHNARSAALSITQASETGLVYTPDEITDLSKSAHEHGLRVHMDGARFANAVAALGFTPAELSWKAGIDVLCLGATKCGALAAEAVIFFNRELADNFVHRRKRAGHLLSKGRFFGAQFVGWLQNGHWLQLAEHANRQAARLAEELSSVSAIRIVWPVQANEIFVVMPRKLAHSLRAAGADFYEWHPEALPSELDLHDDEVFVRFVTSFATQDDQIEQFCSMARRTNICPGPGQGLG